MIYSSSDETVVCGRGERERVLAGRPMGGSQGKLLRRNPLAILKTFGSIRKARNKPSQVSESFITQKGFKYCIYMSKRDPWIHEEESWGERGFISQSITSKTGREKIRCHLTHPTFPTSEGKKHVFFPAEYPTLQHSRKEAIFPSPAFPPLPFPTHHSRVMWGISNIVRLHRSPTKKSQEKKKKTWGDGEKRWGRFQSLTQKRAKRKIERWFARRRDERWIGFWTRGKKKERAREHPYSAWVAFNRNEKSNKGRQIGKKKPSEKFVGRCSENKVLWETPTVVPVFSEFASWPYTFFPDATMAGGSFSNSICAQRIGRKMVSIIESIFLHVHLGGIFAAVAV